MSLSRLLYHTNDTGPVNTNNDNNVTRVIIYYPTPDLQSVFGRPAVFYTRYFILLSTTVIITSLQSSSRTGDTRTGRIPPVSKQHDRFYVAESAGCVSLYADGSGDTSSSRTSITHPVAVLRRRLCYALITYTARGDEII